MGRWIVVALVASGLTGCGGNKAACTIPNSPGGVVGKVDGEAWNTGGAAWNETSTGIQITMDSGDGYRITFSLQETLEGIALTEVLENGPVPSEVSFDNGEQGFALLYADGESGSMTTQGTLGGYFTIEEVTDGVIGACFTFDAESVDRTAVVEGGLRAPPL